MPLTDELEKIRESDIAIVMNDGMTYRGKLVDFDSETLIMENVYEASQNQVDWIKSCDGNEGGSSTLRGYMTWRRITLPKLLARTDKILRVWPWVATDEDE